eukprot:3580878-Amphidinium_carterae.2
MVGCVLKDGNRDIPPDLEEVSQLTSWLVHIQEPSMGQCLLKKLCSWHATLRGPQVPVVLHIDLHNGDEVVTLTIGISIQYT